MKKLICIKPYRDYLIKDKIYEYNAKLKYDKGYEYQVFCEDWKQRYLNYPYLTFSYQFIKEHFITLAEYRDIQINNILNE